MSELPETPILAKPETLLRLPVGVASPLWGFYAGAAASGAAWWWMTRWARPQNLEALFGGAADAKVAVEAEIAVLEAPVFEGAADAVDAPAEAVAEAIVEAEAVIDVVEEAAVEALAEPEAVVMAEAPPLPKPKKAAAKPADLDGGADHA